MVTATKRPSHRDQGREIGQHGAVGDVVVIDGMAGASLQAHRRTWLVARD
jgi:hypothetical protein